MARRSFRRSQAPSQLSIAENVERLEQMHDLMEVVVGIEKDNAPDVLAVDAAKTIVSNSDTLLNDCKGQMEMVIDAKILSSAHNILKGAVQNVDTSLRPFNMDDYANGIEAYVKSAGRSTNLNWQVLAEETFVLFKSAPRLNYKLGTFELDPPPKPEKVARERAKPAVKREKAQVKAVEVNEPEKEVKHYVEHILKCLAQSYRNNDRKPINYFKFVLDPTDFWRSVQNVYHFSHIIKDDKAIMALDENKIPTVSPMRKLEEPVAQIQRRKQFNFRLTPYEHEQLVRVFNITEAAITKIGKQ